MGQTPSKKSRKGKDKAKDDGDRDIEGPHDPSDSDLTASIEDQDGNGAQRRATAPDAGAEYASAAIPGMSAFTVRAGDALKHSISPGDGPSAANGTGPHPQSYVCIIRFFGRSFTKHAPLLAMTAVNLACRQLQLIFLQQTR